MGRSRGHTGGGETSEQAVLREVEEETGLRIRSSALRGNINFINKGRDFKTGKEEPDWSVDVYYTTEFDGEVIQTNNGRLEWLLESEVLALPMHEGDRKFFDPKKAVVVEWALKA